MPAINRRMSSLQCCLSSPIHILFAIQSDVIATFVVFNYSQCVFNDYAASNGWDDSEQLMEGTWKEKFVQ